MLFCCFKRPVVEPSPEPYPAFSSRPPPIRVEPIRQISISTQTPRFELFSSSSFNRPQVLAVSTKDPAAKMMPKIQRVDTATEDEDDNAFNRSQQQEVEKVEDIEDKVELRKKKDSTSSNHSSNAVKQCRVLFSYQPNHEDELELKLDDVVEFMGEVEDGWWRGKLKGKMGVFPSNFVEMISVRNPLTVENQNKKNENHQQQQGTRMCI